jgi:nucleotide-binding universal stress UspA family protein
VLSTIAVGIDGSDTAGRALEAAIDLAERHDARLLVISSYHPVAAERLRPLQDAAPADIQWSINPTSEVDAILEHAAQRARERGLKVTTAAAEGSPADVLCRLAADQRADLLVVGNKGMNRRVLGSVPNSVAHKAHCTVMIVKTS